ncbi:hypothetical protein LC082_13235 [Microbacterium esteraromaticum]|uniref:hypothetical protein n=1 Tax=Microbacterium esteraromaticum TaxID=57043 RepID=UPI001CD2E41A|nr:hypothetical protein [Microbacterium esteraromaticum]MCA1307860.1 hypothetical protein [Microbacterium esteraromaticum]
MRPTKRCLDDLGLRFPPLDVPLPEAAHDLIVKAQRLPDEFASGGAERVLAIDDRVWFKVKVGEYRGAGGQVVEVPDDVPTLWWLMAGGLRRADTKEQDFYGALEAECRRAAKGASATVDSRHLLPQDIDHRRWRAEQTALGVVALQRVVRELICRSAHASGPVEATSQAQGLIAWFKSQDGETYLAIGAEGFLDPREVAVVLSAVPEMTAEDWRIEPGEVLGITPGVGQLVYSAMLPPESLAAMLDDSSGGYL